MPSVYFLYPVITSETYVGHDIAGSRGDVKKISLVNGFDLYAKVSVLKPLLCMNTGTESARAERRSY
jgi:hypothetical protein